MFRFVAPAGSPLKLNQVLHSASAAISSNDPTEESLQTVATHLGVKRLFGTCSGRSALWLALRSLHRLQPTRDVVAIPAYTCFSVPAAIVRAGLKIHPIDVDPTTLDFDPAELASLRIEKLLCIVPCNLFGFPSDIFAVRKIAMQSGAYVIDDAAQALGSNSDGRPTGTRGDVGIYSLGRGKSVGSVGGGLLVTDSDEIAAVAQSEHAALVDGVGATNGGKLLLKMVGYSLGVRPRLFWIPNSLPFLKLGVTEFDPSFTTSRMHPVSAALLQQLLRGLDEINQIRQSNAKRIMDELSGSSKLDFPRAQSCSSPTFVRLPIAACDSATRDRAVAILREAGLGATAFYPSAICDIPGIEKYMNRNKYHCTRAEELSRRLFTVPVHPFVSPLDVERIIEILARS